MLAASLSTTQAEVVTHRAAEAEAIAREQRRAATLRARAAVKSEGGEQDIIVLTSSEDEDDKEDKYDGTIIISDLRQ